MMHIVSSSMILQSRKTGIISIYGILCLPASLPTAQFTSRLQARCCLPIKLPKQFKQIVSRNMKLKIFFLFIVMTMLSACSTGQASAQINSMTEEPLLASRQPTTAPTSGATLAPLVDTPTLASTAVSKPPLAKDVWMQMPVVPNGVNDAMRAVYQRGLAQGNDPTHFSIIADCQNVSSYFLSTFDKPGDYSLGTQHAYLQPTIHYYQGSYSSVTL